MAVVVVAGIDGETTYVVACGIGFPIEQLASHRATHAANRSLTRIASPWEMRHRADDDRRHRSQ